MALNAARLRPLGAIKRMVVPAGRQPRRVLSGFYRNLMLQIDLQSQTQLLLGLWERECYPYLSLALERAHWAIDVGAGKGELCMVFMRQPRRIRVIAIEPQATDLIELRENLVLNGLQEHSLEIVQRIVSPVAGPQAIALDEIKVDRSLRGFLKIDVDGAEMDVLRSGDKLILPHQTDVLIETHSPELERDCRTWLDDRGFATTIVRNAWWRALVPEYRTIEHNRWLWATSKG
jgi:precorrin-6B methylase 2